jgi:prophage antirepressor-like protein
MSKSTIRPFLFESEVTVRGYEQENQLWFVLVDLCRGLGHTNPAEAARGLDDDEKGISSIDTLGGRQELIVVNESGLYSLIFKSRKPDAVKFRRWVTSEVLPSLRQSGRYALDHTHGSVLPYGEKPLAERRLLVSEVNLCRLVNGKGAAMWMWAYNGLPIPPRYLLPAWVQGDLLTPSSHATI